MILESKSEVSRSLVLQILRSTRSPCSPCPGATEGDDSSVLAKVELSDNVNHEHHEPIKPGGDPDANPVQSLADAIAKAIRQNPTVKLNTSEASWNSRMGPPPTWQHSRKNVRAFYKWERTVKVWRLQISSYHLDIEKINSANGLDYLMESLRGGLQLADFEGIMRSATKSIRTYIHR